LCLCVCTSVDTVVSGSALWRCVLYFEDVHMFI